MWAPRARSIVALLLVLAVTFGGFRALTRPRAGDVAVRRSSGAGRKLSQPATEGSSASAATSVPHVAAAIIHDLDAGKFVIMPVPAANATTVTPQPQPATYCIQRPAAAKLSFQLMVPAAGGAPEQYLAATESAVVAVLDEIYSMPPSHARAERVLLNIGSGPGFYTSHAAAAGFDAVAFDPQPACVALQHKSAAANHHEQRVRLLNVGVGGGGHHHDAQPHGAQHHHGHHGAVISGRFEVHTDRCDSAYTAPFHQTNHSSSSSGGGGGMRKHQHELEAGAAGTHVVSWVVLKHFLFHRRLRVLKVDVGGAEVRVLDSALELFWKAVEYLVVRVFRDRWEEHGVTHKHGDAAFQALMYGARRVVHVDSHTEVQHGSEFSHSYVNGHTYLFEFGAPIDLGSIQARHALRLCG